MCAVAKVWWIRFWMSIFGSDFLGLHLPDRMQCNSILLTLHFFSPDTGTQNANEENHLHLTVCVCRGHCIRSMKLYHYVHCIMCLPRILMWIRVEFIKFTFCPLKILQKSPNEIKGKKSESDPATKAEPTALLKLWTVYTMHDFQNNVKRTNIKR